MTQDKDLSQKIRDAAFGARSTDTCTSWLDDENTQLCGKPAVGSILITIMQPQAPFGNPGMTGTCPVCETHLNQAELEGFLVYRSVSSA